MEYPGSLEQTHALAQDAVSRMAERQVRATPPNFTVWYNYLSGKYPDLARSLDLMLGDKAKPSETDWGKLFETYFGSEGDDELLKGTSTRIERALTQVLELIAQAGGNASRYEKSLAGIDNALEGADEADAVHAVVTQLRAATQEMQARTANLEERLRASSAQVKTLRQDLEHSRLEASTDGLTGIPNRKTFDRSLRDAAREADEEGTPLSLLLVDIDFFKKFNDVHGHQLGDEVLKLVARELTYNVKGRDTAARYGGEEFAIILPQTALANAATVADNIRAAVAKRKIIKRASGESLGNITLSIGVAGYRSGEALSDFIQRADEALYAAKGAGRNRVAREHDSIRAKSSAA